MRPNFSTPRFACLAALASACALSLTAAQASAAPVINGAIVASKCEQGAATCPPLHLWLIDPMSGAEHALTAGADAEDTPSFSPDGSRVLFRRCPSGGANCRIAVIGADGSGEHDLTDGSAGSDDYPSFSPDGTRIAFTRGNDQIYTMAADGTGTTPLGVVSSSAPKFSPDGASIVFSRYESGKGYRIFTVPSGGGTPVALTLGPKDFDPSWSPDGSHIVFSRSNGNAAIWVMDSNGANQHPLTPFALSGDDSEPTYSPDGSQIVFERTSSVQYGPSPLMVMNSDGSDVHPVTPASEYFYKADWQALHPVAPAPAADTTAPVLKLSAPRKESIGKGRLYLFATSNEAATALVRGGSTVPVASKRLALKRASRTLAPNTRTKIQLKLGKRSLRSIRSALAHHRRIKARLALSVTDGAGNVTRKALTIALKR
jgi:Tol biopolymer transport system component